MYAFLTAVAPEYLPIINVKSLTTLVNEHVHGCMRERYPMPTQLEFAQAFPSAVEESVKRVSFAGF